MEDRDVEVFERIPWESLEQNHDRRWLGYLLAGAILLTAVGVTIGRGTAAPAPVTVTPGTSVAVSPPTTGQPAEPVAVTTTSPALWEEADLMALPVASLELEAAAVAEWFVVDHFTRDEGSDGRSFVDWARAARLSWTDTTTAEVTVLIRRLAAAEEEPYQRLPLEGWKVTARLRDRGWVVVDGPMAVEASATEMALEGGGGSGEDATWTDGAGLTWEVKEAPTGEES